MMLPSVHSTALNCAVAAGATQAGVDTLWLPDHLLGFWHPALWSDFPAAAVTPDPDAFLDPFCVAARVQPYADGGLEHILLADMSSLACGPGDAQQAIEQLGLLIGHLRDM